MTRLFANPFIMAVHAALLHRMPMHSSRERRAGNRTLARSSRKSQMRRFWPRVRFLLRSSNPVPRPYRGVAHLFLKRMAASLVDRHVHRTDEASRPKSANRLPGHPGSFAPFAPPALRSLLLRGSLSAPKHLGSIPWAKPSRSCSIIQVLFFESGL